MLVSYISVLPTLNEQKQSSLPLLEFLVGWLVGPSCYDGHPRLLAHVVHRLLVGDSVTGSR